MLIAPLSLSDCKYKQFKEAIERHIKPKEKLLIAERTKFWQMRQEPGEDVDTYLQRIRFAAKQCEFERLKENTASEELCRVQLISGLKDKEMTTRVLNYLETKSNSTADEIVDYIRRQLDVNEFTHRSTWDEGQVLLTSGKTKNFVSKHSKPKSFSSKTSRKPCESVDFKNCHESKPCSKCGSKHAYGQCPAYGKNCRKCGGKNHFQQVCRKVI